MTRSSDTDVVRTGGPSNLGDYSARFGEHFAMERRDGVLHVRMHSEGGPARFSLALKRAWAHVWQAIGADPENEVIIFSGTGDAWIAGVDPESFSMMNDIGAAPADVAYDFLYSDATKMIAGLVYNIDVPTIGVINGPGPRKETALLCDITLCADDAPIRDGNFAVGHAPPGDGMHLVLQELLGPKQAAYLLLTGASIQPAGALELGLVNEVLPRSELMPRAWEIARQLMASPPTSRKLTHAIVQRPWRRRVAEDLGFGIAHVSFGARLGLGQH